MWNNHPFETGLEEKLKTKLGLEKGEARYLKYVSFREQLVTHIFPKIIAVDPSLSEHGAEHIQNIFGNTLKLLQSEIDNLTPYEHYLLALGILFHDVGNIFGRRGHKWRVPDIYKELTSELNRDIQEMNLVRIIAEGHTGKTKKGSLDTIGSISKEESFLGEPIRLQELACIVRFADELAEGPQRRHLFLIEKEILSKDEKKLVEENSLIYHEYAKITRIYIDRLNDRIAITYEVNLEKENNDLKYLQYIFPKIQERLLKTDLERKYVRHYSNLLLPFSKISVRFNFYKEDIPCYEIEGISLEDEPIVPGSDIIQTGENPLFDKFPNCSPESIWEQLSIE